MMISSNSMATKKCFEIHDKKPKKKSDISEIGFLHFNNRSHDANGNKLICGTAICCATSTEKPRSL
jgi:hypothetical protein